MSELAEFLASHHDAIVARFSDQARSRLSSEQPLCTVNDRSREALQLLEQALRQEDTSATRPGPPLVHREGGLEAFAREVELLRDCIAQELHASKLSPPRHELERLWGLLSSWVIDAIAASESEQRRTRELVARRHQEALMVQVEHVRQATEEASRLKDEFLSTLSRELRTPLNTILGWTSLLRSPQLTHDRRIHALEIIERSVRSQAQLLENMLELSELTDLPLQLEPQPDDVVLLLREVIELVRPRADARSLNLRASLLSRAPVRVDSQRFRQAMVSLLDDAIKFTPEGGRVQIAMRRVDTSVEIEVADTGEGIAPDRLPHLFDRFRPPSSATRRSRGLGLSFVRQIVELHDGTLLVASDGPGLGSTFTVRLPLCESAPPAPPPPPAVIPPSSPSILRGLEVLAVDDDPDTRELLRAILADAGVRVRLARSASEAFALFLSAPPDLLVCDIGMPDEDGCSLLARIRALRTPQGSQVPAVALTAYARSEDRVRVLRAGFHSYLAKPVEPGELIAVLESLHQRLTLS